MPFVQARSQLLARGPTLLHSYRLINMAVLMIDKEFESIAQRIGDDIEYRRRDNGFIDINIFTITDQRQKIGKIIQIGLNKPDGFI